MKNITEIIEHLTQHVENIQNSYPSLEELQNGEYEAMWYAYTFELRDGRKYKTKYGVRRSRRMTEFEKYFVQDGEITELD